MVTGMVYLGFLLSLSVGCFVCFPVSCLWSQEWSYLGFCCHYLLGVLSVPLSLVLSMVTGMVYLGFCCHYLLGVLSVPLSLVLSMVTGMVYLGFCCHYLLGVLSVPLSLVCGHRNGLPRVLLSLSVRCFVCSPVFRCFVCSPVFRCFVCSPVFRCFVCSPVSCLAEPQQSESWPKEWNGVHRLICIICF